MSSSSRVARPATGVASSSVRRTSRSPSLCLSKAVQSVPSVLAAAWTQGRDSLSGPTISGRSPAATRAARSPPMSMLVAGMPSASVSDAVRCRWACTVTSRSKAPPSQPQIRSRLSGWPGAKTMSWRR
jgi:hypothetical protein